MNTNTNIKNIVVLMGGWSSEREISLLSGKSVSKSLKEMGFEVTEIDVKKDLRYLTDELYKASPEFVFNALHGVGGEDGVIQGILEVFGVPYSNSGLLASALAFDKAVCKTLAKSSGVRVAEGFEITKDEIHKLDNEIKVEFPFVIKPAANGSTVGVYLIFNNEDLHKVKNTDWSFGDKIMVEKYINGREFTVLVGNGKAIGAVEITFKNALYDYESKYEIGGSTHISSFEMHEAAIKEMFEMAERIYEACGCRGLARADFRYDEKDVYFLELNTQPGMTELSLAPDIGRFAGKSMSELLLMNFN